MFNLNFVTPKRHFLRETASYEPSCVKIGSVVFPLEDGKKKKKREGKGRHKKSRKRYISRVRRKAPRERIFTKFCTSGDMLDIIICANFDVEKLSGLGNTKGQILGSPIEMAGHSYNSAALPLHCCSSRVNLHQVDQRAQTCSNIYTNLMLFGRLLSISMLERDQSEIQ